MIWAILRGGESHVSFRLPWPQTGIRNSKGMVKMKTRLKKQIFALCMAIILMASAVMNAGAVAGRAYSIGGEFHNGDDVRSACDYFGLCGYSSWYSTNPTYSYLNSSYVLNSDILYFSAHGNQDYIQLLNNVYLHDGYGAYGNAIDIRNFSLSNTKLVIYDACLTASNGDGSGINLCTTTRDRGANAVLGWKVIIGVTPAFEWQKRFQNRLALGHTITNAVAYADQFSYSDNSVKSHTLYGNGNQVIKKSRAAASASLQEEFPEQRQIVISPLQATYATLQYDLVAQALAEQIPGFDASDYRVECTPTSEDGRDFVIDYTKKAGEFITDSGYTVIFQNGRADRVYDNTASAPLSLRFASRSSAFPPKATEQVRQAAFSQAAQVVADRNDGSVVKKQRGEPYYEIETGRYYYRVFTEYYAGGTEAVGAFETLYALQ